MSEIRKIEVFQFEELEDDAKEKAREWWRTTALDYEWWEYSFQDFSKICEILGIDIDTCGANHQGCIYFHGFGSKGDGSSFEGSYSYAKGSAAKLKEHAPKDKELHRIADGLTAIQRHYFYKLTANIHTGSGYGGNAYIKVDVGHEDTGNATDAAEQEITTLLESLNHWLFLALQREYIYLLSDEATEAGLTENEYSFLADGQRCSLGE